MTKTGFTPEQKIRIVLESIRTSTGTARLCRKHGARPAALQAWRRRFLDAGKAGLAHRGNADPARVPKRDDNPKLVMGEMAVANDVLKKTLVESRYWVRPGGCNGG